MQEARANFTEVRDYLSQEIKEMDLPWKPLETKSGYFLLADVSQCRPLVPESYLQSHDYDDNGLPKVHLYMPPRSAGNSSDKAVIPLDLAFCRWMAL